MRSVFTPGALVALVALGVGLTGALGALEVGLTGVCALRHRAPAHSGGTAAGGRISPAFKVQRLRGGVAHGGEPQVLKLEAATCPDKTLALTNHAYLHSADYARIFGDANDRFVQIGGFIFAASGSDAVAAGSVAFNSAQRKTLKVSSGDEIEVTALTELPQSKIHAAALELAVDFAGRASPASEVCVCVWWERGREGLEICACACRTMAFAAACARRSARGVCDLTCP
jgi:hypothetical protein